MVSLAEDKDWRQEETAGSVQSLNIHLHYLLQLSSLYSVSCVFNQSMSRNVKMTNCGCTR